MQERDTTECLDKIKNIHTTMKRFRYSLAYQDAK